MLAARRHHTRALAAAVAVAAVSASPGAGAVAARSSDPGPAVAARVSAADARIPLREYGSSVLRSRARPTVTAPVGTVRTWLSLDEREDGFVPAPFRLAGTGEHVEIWIASDLGFPANDCRNGVDAGARIAITPAQVAYLVEMVDRTIYTRLSQAFSVAPSRDGTRARADPSRYDSRGEGDDIVVLVDNVRDGNYYDLDNASNQPYIAGFFSSGLVDFFDRNVLTVDGYDWLHRTGATPPHSPVPGDLCSSAPARPYLYEATLAHEYHHLLEHYEDRNEVTWVDEGLADLAQRITGFVDPRLRVSEVGHDVHVQCFLGWLGVQTDANPNPREGGPENSLTRWSEHSGEILCDYGAAFTFMEFLAGRYGTRFVRELHRDDAGGMDGLRSVLRRLRIRATVDGLVRDWAAMLALDDALDRGARFAGVRSRYRTATLRGAVNWATRRAYNSPGAPPNGSDFVRLRDGRGRSLHARDLRSLRFAADAGTFSVQLVAYPQSARGRARLVRLPLRARRGSLDRQALRRRLGTSADVVGAIVTVHDPGGNARAYRRYRLDVNGVRQPGG